MKRILSFILCLLFLNTSCLLADDALDLDDFCQKKLNEKINEILEKDQNNIISKLFHLSQLKLAHAASDKNKNLESYISTKLKQLNSSQRAALTDDIKKLYSEYGKDLTGQEVNTLLSDLAASNYSKLNTRIQAEQMPAVIRLISSIDKNCGASSLLCLNQDDEALYWLVAKIKKGGGFSQAAQNLMDSAAVAHYNGYVRADSTLSKAQTVQALAQTNIELDQALNKVKQDFFNRYKECLSYFGDGNCFKQKTSRGLIEAIKDLVTIGPKANSDPNIKQPELVLSGLRKNLNVYLNPNYVEQVKQAKQLERETQPVSSRVNSLKARVQNLDEPVDPKMCGGKKFQSQIKNIETFGFSDPVSSLKSAKKAFDTHQSGGKDAVKGMNNKLDIFSKFHIPGPFFRCGPEPVRKVPKFAYKKADKLVCCDEKEDWRKLHYLFASFSGGFSCRFFVGLPYIAELGAKVGASVGIGFGGGIEPTDCLDKSCGQGKVSFTVSAAIYGEVLVGLASVQGTISWVPYASIKQCMYPYGAIPPANLAYKVGTVILIGTVRAGWAFTYEVVKPVYESSKVTSMDIAIF
jgi:hypothetical protein